MAQSILMVQLYSNGDCLYATTVARQIKVDFPGCRLTWAVASFCKSIILNNPFIDEILEVKDVAKDDVYAYRRLKKQFLQNEKDGLFDKVFFINNIESNIALYDGCIRSNIFNAYPGPITVPIQPVLRLYPDEISRVQDFAKKHDLDQFSNVVLFEFAPQSGQAILGVKQAVLIAEQIAKSANCAVILSSAHKVFSAQKGVIDGSELSIRETVALTHYCTFLLGTSSGITWASTSDAGKILPMVQLLNPNAVWSNFISTDFKRFSIPNKGLIEIADTHLGVLVDCVLLALSDVEAAKIKYHDIMPVSFKTSRRIVYNLLCFFQFSSIATHIRINIKIHGLNPAFFTQVFLGFVYSPFKLIWNISSKKIMPLFRKPFLGG